MGPQGKTKTFWERPEGTPGMILLAAIIVGGGIGLYKIAPFLVELMQNLYYLIGMGMGLFFILYMAADPKIRLLIGHLYKSGVRAITQMFIELNPVGIIKGYVVDLQVKRNKMADQITSLKGEIGKLARKMQEEDENFKTKMGLAAAAKKRGGDRDPQVGLNTSSAGRAKKAYAKFKILHDRMENMYDILKQMHTYSGHMVTDLTDQVKYIEIERDAITASHSVMKSAQSIISGNNDEKLLFDQAMEHIVDDIGAKIGEMDHYMDMSADFIDGVDLENMVFQESGLKMLEQWEGGNNGNFLAEGTTNYIDILNSTGAEKEAVPVNATITNVNSTTSNSASKSKYIN